MAGTMSINVREMTPDDYDKVYELWMSIQGFGIRSIDDSRLGGMTQKNRMKILFLPPFRMMKDVKKIKAISCELSAAS